MPSGGGWSGCRPGLSWQDEGFVMSFLRHKQIYQSDLPICLIYGSTLDFRDHFEEDDNTLAGSPRGMDRVRLPQGNKPPFKPPGDMTPGS
jgi:hypothetical protein